MSDALVIGGGIIGLLTARDLARGGASVTLIEKGETGRESTWAGGGIISPLYPWRYDESITALAEWSQHDYPGLCQALHEEGGLDPEYVVNGLLILDTEERAQAETWASTHQVRLEILDADAVQRLEPALGISPDQALFLPAIAQVRNPRLAKSARRALDGRIGIREHEELLELLVEGGRIRGVRTTRGEINADQVVICSGAWTAPLVEHLGAAPDIAPVRGQMILFLANPGEIRTISLYQDRYVIPRRDGHVLIGSTIEHTGFVKATTPEAKEALYRSAVALFPMLKHTPIETHWAGLRPGSPSGVPYICAYPGVDGLFLNAGHFRNGVVTGPASARLVSDLMLGRTPVLDPAPYALNATR